MRTTSQSSQWYDRLLLRLSPNPEEHEDRFRNTKVHLVVGKYSTLANLVWFFQSFHLIHHLFPKIPFYRYPQAFKKMRPLLEKAGSEITVHGQELPVHPDMSSQAGAKA